jgi:hypothetical protein
MNQTIELKCKHEPKTHRLVFACQITGDYMVDLCKNCHDDEPKEFLIDEVKLS